ncbi:hypothetical protein MRX96_030667 [Rhipicephalus microplus]
MRGSPSVEGIASSVPYRLTSGFFRCFVSRSPGCDSCALFPFHLAVHFVGARTHCAFFLYPRSCRRFSQQNKRHRETAEPG